MNLVYSCMYTNKYTIPNLNVLVCAMLLSGLLIFSQGIMLVYDVTNQRSFDNIKHWIRDIEEVQECIPTVDVMIVTAQNAPADVEKMILGNKFDFKKSRVVSRKHGQQVMYMYMYNTVYMSSLHSLSLSLSSSILSSLSSSSHSLLFPLAC